VGGARLTMFEYVLVCLAGCSCAFACVAVCAMRCGCGIVWRVLSVAGFDSCWAAGLHACCRLDDTTRDGQQSCSGPGMHAGHFMDFRLMHVHLHFPWISYSLHSLRRSPRRCTARFHLLPSRPAVQMVQRAPKAGARLCWC